MLGIVRIYKDDGCGNYALNQVIAKNDVSFEFSNEGYSDVERFSKGFASFMTVDKFNPVDCKKHHEYIEMEIFRNCNEEEWIFRVEIDGDGISIKEPEFITH